MNKQLQGSGKTENTIIRDIFDDYRVSLFQRCISQDNCKQSQCQNKTNWTTRKYPQKGNYRNIQPIAANMMQTSFSINPYSKLQP
jgi:hypothetical protein